MFTGIVSALGEIVKIERRAGLIRWSVASGYDATGVALGASICHAGCCLTVVEREASAGGMLHVVEIGQESIEKTTLAAYQEGARINLERSLKMGDELGGHIVTGHVDGVGEVLSVEPDGEGWRVLIRAPDSLAYLIAQKGSIAVDGVSLTVNSVEGPVFGVLIIPHTWKVTTLGRTSKGLKVNLEVDPLARYVARLLEGPGRPGAVS